MALVHVVEVGTFAGDAYMENTEDGRMGVFDHYAFATDGNGKDYIHLVPFRRSHDQRLADLVGRIRVAGVIDTAHWVEAPPRMSLEDRFALYAEREDMVRRGFLAEDDMYHGID